MKFGYFVSTTGAVGDGTTHVFNVVLHALHVGAFAPVAHTLVRNCVIEPVCPDGHERVCDCEESGEQAVDVDGVIGTVGIIVDGVTGAGTDVLGVK